MKNKRPFLVQDEKEKESLVKRIIEKTKEISTFEKEVHKRTYGTYRIIFTEYLGRYTSMEVTCTENGTFNEYNWNSSEEEVYYNFFMYHLRNILTYEIRMKGSIEHIKILEEFIGKERTLVVLKNFALKNRIVAQLLENYIESSSKSQELKDGN